MTDSEISIQRQLDSICSEYKDDWSINKKKSIKDLANQFSDPYREQLIGKLLAVDIELSQIFTGQPAKPNDYEMLGEDAVVVANEILKNQANSSESLEKETVPHQSKAAPVASSTRDESNSSSTHHLIGRYKLLQQIGEGGMGTVWMAEQEEPVRRRVALKLIKSTMADEQVIARFEAERQALAMMDHPNIAKVLDAGTGPNGSPYFVMELIQGIPINEYCDRNKLNPNERLQLFIPVCKAVQHAHQKGIIHRDLKPSNVLVQIHDGEPVTKVIDFGLAKALQHQTKLTDKTMFTEFGQVVGTLQYMSPEQATMDAMAVDTRSDIYSLGVMLYELLAGSTPVDKETLQGNALLQILETIREKEPPKPSDRLSSSGDGISTISELRQIEPSKLQQILRGELDWIVMKALEKNRTRRYETASDFAQDINNYLNGDPVEARPPSAKYRLQKFLVKNRGLVGAAAAILSLMVITTIVSIALSLWAYTEKKRADINAGKLNEEIGKVSDAKEVADKKAKEAHESAQAVIASQIELEKQLTVSQIARMLAESQLEYEQDPGASIEKALSAQALAKNADERLDRFSLNSWLMELTAKTGGKRFAHEDEVSAFEFTPSESAVVSASNKKLYLWDLTIKNQKVPKLLCDLSKSMKKSDSIERIVFIPGSKDLFLAIGSNYISLCKLEENRVIVRDEIVTEKWGYLFRGFSPDGRFAIIGREEGPVDLYLIGDGSFNDKRVFRGRPFGKNSMAISPDSKWLFTRGDRNEGTLIWNLQEDEAPPIAVGGGFDQWVQVDKECRWIAVGGVKLDQPLQRIPRLRGLILEAKKIAKNGKRYEIKVNGTSMEHFLFTPNGYNVIAMVNGNVYTTSIFQNRLKSENGITLDKRLGLVDHAGCDKLELSPDGKWLVAHNDDPSYSKDSVLWKIGHRLAEDSEVVFKGPLAAYALSKNAGMAVLGFRNNRMRAWLHAYRKQPIEIVAHSSKSVTSSRAGIKSLLFSPTSKFQASCGNDNTIRVFDCDIGRGGASNGVRLAANPVVDITDSSGTGANIFSPDGNWMVANRYLYKIDTAKPQIGCGLAESVFDRERLAKGSSPWHLMQPVGMNPDPVFSADSRWMLHMNRPDNQRRSATDSNDFSLSLWHLDKTPLIRPVEFVSSSRPFLYFGFTNAGIIQAVDQLGQLFQLKPEDMRADKTNALAKEPSLKLDVSGRRIDRCESLFGGRILITASEKPVSPPPRRRPGVLAETVFRSKSRSWSVDAFVIDAGSATSVPIADKVADMNVSVEHGIVITRAGENETTFNVWRIDPRTGQVDRSMTINQNDFDSVLAGSATIRATKTNGRMSFSNRHRIYLHDRFAFLDVAGKFYALDLQSLETPRLVRISDQWIFPRFVPKSSRFFVKNGDHLLECFIDPDSMSLETIQKTQLGGSKNWSLSADAKYLAVVTRADQIKVLQRGKVDGEFVPYCVLPDTYKDGRIQFLHGRNYLIVERKIYAIGSEILADMLLPLSSKTQNLSDGKSGNDNK